MPLIVGIDEAGRGPWAGPVVAAGVMLDHEFAIVGLNDSKKLSAKAREGLYDQIFDRALFVSVAVVGPAEIDQINILRATLKAMGQVLAEISSRSPIDWALVDGQHIIPNTTIKQRAIVKGDSLEPSIMAASIVAKVHRDRLMIAYDAEYPGYGFAGHKGYGTKAHMVAIDQLGPCAIHRMSFAPLKSPSLL